MSSALLEKVTIDASHPGALRGDPITAERYYSPEFAQLEWEHMWKKVWHIAGMANELKEAGDYVVHDFMHESVIVIRQESGALRAFYNVCGHRGQRLTWNSGHSDGFHCPYHGWIWGTDGVLKELPDEDDFPQGNPCGKLSLKELQCDTWGGLIWYTMDPNAPPLLEFLEPMPELYKNWPTEKLVRVAWMKIDLETNWKFASDNFSESYHTRTAHPQVPPWIDQDYWTAKHEMFPNGHGRIVQLGRPSLRDRLPEDEPHPFDDTLRAWDIDPSIYPDYETKAVQGWKDLMAAKRKLWKEKGYLHYENMTDDETVDSPHNVFFPNNTFSFLPDGVILFRTEPHPTDPNKCTFDLWEMRFPIEGVDVYETMAGPRPLEDAEFEHRVFDQGRGIPHMAGQIVFQDMSLSEGQQRGLKSQGYTDAYLAGQETRVRYFHEVLNDYLEGRR
ncbi:MAG: aromatic ring-hydroxylating dioxygenase subunit alpha [Proteobacteria bacterium]|nr:aromatic ring-hydroxylating dioxygenase subunit alpha [Pseudomonadota bacterium]